MKKTTYILLGILFIIYFFKCLILLDPDFGWHIQMGNYILSHGIPHTDPFSYTMPGYYFIDHEWLGEVSFSLLYPVLGTIGFSVMFSLFAVLSLMIALYALPREQRQFTSVSVLLVGVALVFFMGVRLQVLSWLFFSILVWIFSQKRRVISYLLPIIFILWTNLHGGFAIGLGFLAAFLFLKTILARRIDGHSLFVFILSLLATCVNPYGIHVWSVILIHASSSLNHWAIQEWLPPIFFTSTFALWFFVALSVMIIFLYRKKFLIVDISLYLILFLLGASSMRHVPFWLLWALPMTIRSLYYFYDEVKINPPSIKAFHKVYKIFFGIICVIAIAELSYDLLQATAISENKFYPKQAILYLSQHPTKGQIFSVYEWGGYLDWKLPDKKVFIDGRMPTWDFNAPKNEEKNVFQTYIDLLHGKVQFKTLAKKYTIDTVMMPTEKVSKNTLLTQLNDLVGKWFHQKNTEVHLEKEFENIGMRVVYKDSIAVIWRKK